MKKKRTSILISSSYYFSFHFPFSIFPQIENTSYKTKRKLAQRT